jgi:hypothetical protein
MVLADGDLLLAAMGMCPADQGGYRRPWPAAMVLFAWVQEGGGPARVVGNG